MSKQSEFFQDQNADSIPDGLQADANRDGRPDWAEAYLKGFEAKVVWTAIAGAIGTLLVVLATTLLADWIGHALGFH